MAVQQQNREQPPPYTEATSGHNQGMINQIVADQQIQAMVSQNQPVPIAVVDSHTGQVTMFTYLRHPRRFEGKQNASNSFKGFLDVIYKEKKLPWSIVKKLIYKTGLLIYYLVNFIYSIIVTGVQGDHIGYHLVYLFISLIGLAYELTDVIIDIRKWVKQCKQNQIENLENQPRQGWTEGTVSLESVESNGQNTSQHDDDSVQPQEEITYKKKVKRVFIDYVLHSLGEMLIYPTFICILYGFINEKAWQFSNGISAFYFLLFLYSVIMDAIYAKFYLIWLVIRIVRASFTKYDELRENELECTRFFTPVYLTIPFAILLAIVQWFMVGIIGARIYVDNFTPDYDTGGIVPNSGKLQSRFIHTIYDILCCVFTYCFMGCVRPA